MQGDAFLKRGAKIRYSCDFLGRPYPSAIAATFAFEKEREKAFRLREWVEWESYPLQPPVN
jgi:hypothetical protein